MPELNINASPLPQSGNASTTAVASADPVDRGVAGVAAETADGSRAPFAAVLNSRIAESGDSAGVAPIPATPELPGDSATSDIPVDLTALFSLLGVDPAVLAGTATPAQQPAPDGAAGQAEGIFPADETLIDTGPLPAALASAAVLPAPTSSSSATRQARDADSALDTRGGPPSPAALQAEVTAGGKFVGQAAISADAEALPRESVPPAADDFRALLDRATGNGVAATGPTVASARPTGAPLRVDTPMGLAGWQEDVGQKLSWMADARMQHAELVLTPPQLGRVEVTLSLAGDQATAVFTSPNPAVREALENSMARLREVLADAGVNLGQTQVGAESPNRSPQSARAVRDDGEHPRLGVASLATPAAGAVRSAGRGMIDVFA